MKNMKKVLVGLVLCLSLVFITGCGSDKLKGAWSGESNDGLKSTFTFDGKGEVTYKNDFYENKGTYTIENNKVTIKDVWSDNKVYEFTIKDDKLTLTATDNYSPSYKNLGKN